MAGQLGGLSGPELAGERVSQEEEPGLELAFRGEAAAPRGGLEGPTFQGLVVKGEEAAQAFQEQGTRVSQGEDTE